MCLCNGKVNVLLIFMKAVRLADESLIHLAIPSLSSFITDKGLDYYVTIQTHFKSISCQWPEIGVINFF